MGRVDAIYGTHDHLVLIFARIADFAAKDRDRKQRVESSSDTPENQSLSEASQAALAEWKTIYAALEGLEAHFGPGFQPLSTQQPFSGETPFGQPLMYPSHDIAVIWAMYNAAHIIALRTHPHMPAAAATAANAAAGQTAQYARLIGRIVAGMLSHSRNRSLEDAVGGLVSEVTLSLFIAGLQFQKQDERILLIKRLRELEIIIGPAFAGTVAKTCEEVWVDNAAAGRGPPYLRAEELGLYSGEQISHASPLSEPAEPSSIHSPEAYVDERLVNPCQWNAELSAMEESIIKASCFGAIKAIPLLDLPECRSFYQRIISSVERMRRDGYCGQSINLVVTRQHRERVAELVSIPLDRMMALQNFDDFSICAQFLDYIGLQQTTHHAGRMAFTDQLKALEWAATIIVKILDLVVVSYSGAHLENFVAKGLDYNAEDTSEIRITDSLIFRPRYLQCLDAYFHHEQIWVLEEVYSHKARSHEPLYLLTTMEVFSDIWGPVWAVYEHDRVKRFNIGVGSVFPWTVAATEVRPLDGEIFAHWTDEESAFVKMDATFPPNAEKTKLLIGAKIFSINDSCALDLTDATTSLREQGLLASLGTRRSRMYIESGNIAALVTPPGVQLGGQLQWKIRRGSTLKDSILAAWGRNPYHRDLRVLSGWYGVEVSVCTGNARRQRLGRTLGSWTMQNYLECAFLDWPSEECKRSYFEALNLEDSAGGSAFGQLYRTRPEWRQAVAEAILCSLEALRDTGTQGSRHSFAALLSPNTHEAWKMILPRTNQNWAGLLKDTVESCALGITTPDCLEFTHDRWPSLCQSSRLNGVTPSQQQICRVLETALLINERASIPAVLKKCTENGSKSRWTILNDATPTALFDLGESGRLSLLCRCDEGVRAIMAWKSPSTFGRIQEKMKEDRGGHSHHWELVLDISSRMDPISIYVTSANA